MWDWSTYYIFLTALLVGYSFLYFYDKKKKSNLFFLIMGLLPTFILMAFRGRTVGIDLAQYEIHVFEAKFFSSQDFLKFLSEPLFQIIYWISYKLGGLQAFIIITSSLEYLFLGKALNNLHKRGLDVRLLYLFLIAYVVIRSCNIIRNCIGVLCSLCAYTYLYDASKSNQKKYWFFSVLALGLHNSAIMNVPIYFLCRPLLKNDSNKSKGWKLSIAFTAVFSLIFYFLLSHFIEFFFLLTSERYGEVHFQARDTWGWGNLLVRLPFLFLVIIFMPLLKQTFGSKFKPFIIITILDIAVAQLKYLFQDFERLTMFTGVGQVVLWSIFAMACKKKYGGFIYLAAFLFGILYFTYYMYHWGVEGGDGIGIGIMPYYFWK